LAEIEQFYLLPNQRRWRTWFPEAMYVLSLFSNLFKKCYICIYYYMQIYFFFSRYYYANVDETRREVERLIRKDEWKTNDFPEMKEKLLKKLQIKHDPIDNEAIMQKLSTLEENNNKVLLQKLSELEENNNKVLLQKLSALEETDNKVILQKLSALKELIEKICVK
jgi:hypothetical protein